MTQSLIPLLERIAISLERLAPPQPKIENIDKHNCFIWSAQNNELTPIQNMSFIDFHLLQGIENQKETLFLNTYHFAKNLPANNVLLWGARGTGKSSLIKSVYHEVNSKLSTICPLLKIIEIPRDDIYSLPILLRLLKPLSYKFIIFSDDLSFESEDRDYKALKSVLDGGIAGRPENVLFYATSNRRHLMPRNMIENESSSAINPSEAIEEKVSLSDRFGLWIGFHNCSKDLFDQIVTEYAKARKLPISKEDLIAQANEWSVTRGARNGRVAWQFIEDLTAKLSSG
ncbi:MULTISPECIES: ATP-binding protein [Commensalibacter]|uniref:ATP-binding protein n=1 Tax=Commensalibacter TaxID=1079922 RepID=UPI0012D9A9D3|nr:MULTISPECIES: ATP-binding protein [Commensalibacter]MCT6842641.1 ATP-binding protein [Commensalibacter sp.]MBI0066601.1 ATP-binding protein [Commensalibacter sp. M0134]MBI0070369.1 ATP-binding protein [Commensalibacter sp. M0133]MBI0075704.1 ATP-binding protein [Commensalibacter sp. M0357]MBI0081916.1 ATP-binding protein [Commensalibacter melissae]